MFECRAGEQWMQGQLSLHLTSYLIQYDFKTPLAPELGDWSIRVKHGNIPDIYSLQA